MRKCDAKTDNGRQGTTVRQVFMPNHLDEVWDILEREPEAMLYAGGTDLLVRLRFSPDTSLETVSGCPEQTVVRRGSSVFCVSKSSETERERMEPPERNERVCEGHPDTSTHPDGKSGINFTGPPVRRSAGSLICLERIDELKSIHEVNGQVFIGSCVTHTKLIENRLIQKRFPVLIKALKVLGSPPVRNIGTIGGNICTASPAGDTLPPLYTLGAVVEIRSIDSNRLVPLKSFIKGPGKTALQKSEVLYGVWINADQDYNICHYEKVGQRKALAIAVASLAAMLKLSESGIIEKAGLAWGSVAPTIVTSREIEKALIGKPLAAESLMPVVSLVEKVVSPVDDVRAGADYRRMVAGNLLFRLLQYRNHGSL